MKPILIRLIYWMALATLASTAAADDSAAEQLLSRSVSQQTSAHSINHQVNGNLELIGYFFVDLI